MFSYNGLRFALPFIAKRRYDVKRTAKFACTLAAAFSDLDRLARIRAPNAASMASPESAEKRRQRNARKHSSPSHLKRAAKRATEGRVLLTDPDVELFEDRKFVVLYGKYLAQMVTEQPKSSTRLTARLDSICHNAEPISTAAFTALRPRKLAKGELVRTWPHINHALLEHRPFRKPTYREPSYRGF
jgi:hypothetical protein